VIVFAALDAGLCLIAAVPIVIYDLRHHRITNLSILAFGTVLLALKLIESTVCFGVASRAIRDGATAFALFLVIYWLSGSSMGLGDVKLAPLLASLAGLGSFRNFILWISMIWMWGGVHALVSAFRNRTLHLRIAFAPALFAGTLTYLAVGIWSSLPQ